MNEYSNIKKEKKKQKKDCYGWVINLYDFLCQMGQNVQTLSRSRSVHADRKLLYLETMS